MLAIPKKQKSTHRLMEREMLDRAFFVREKPLKKQEQKNEENFQLQIENEQNQRKKMKYQEIMNALFQHQQEFMEYHRKKIKQCRKRATHARNYKGTLVIQNI